MTNAVNLASAAGTGFSFRNRIINGDMRIHQRGGSATADGAFPADRWMAFRQAGSFAASQSTDVPVGQGFTSSLLWSSGGNTATTYSGFEQRIEGLNVADLHWGTANAKPITVSFWVKSGLAGTLNIAVRNNASNRSYCATYVVNSANTWEYKTITIQGDTTGTWTTDTSRGIGLWFSTGGTQQQAGDGWSGTGFLTASGTAQVYTGFNFWITGVQLEVGSVATPFERRPYGLELELCRRYYERATGTYLVYGCGYSSFSVARGNYYFTTEMRTNPTVTILGTLGSGGPSTYIDSVSRRTASFGSSAEFVVTDLAANAEL